MRATGITLLFLSISFLGPLDGFSKTYKIDRVHSKVGFEIVKYKIGSPVQGRFDVFNGTVDIADGKMSNVSADIVVASINTENEKRDAHLRSPDFFAVEEASNKKMMFRQSEMATVSDNFKLKGNFTLKGVTKPIVLDVERVKENRYKANVRIDKRDYGVTWNKPLEKNLWKRIKGVVGKTTIGENVDIVLDIILR